MRKVLAAVIAAAAVLAACGEEERRTVPVADLIAAAKHTRAAESQRVQLDMTMAGPGLPGAAEVSGEGVIHNRTRRGRMTMDMSEVDPAAGQVEQIIHGTRFWMRYPRLSQQLGGGKEWLEFDLQELGRRQGLDLNSIMPGTSDPTQQLDQLRAASGDAEVLGTESVRGEETTHYRLTIDMRRYPETVEPAKREAARRSVERLIELAGTSESPTEVWIGHRTRMVHKMRVKAQAKLPQGGTMRMDVRMEYYDFGAPVGDVSPPPAEKTASAAELAP